MFALIVLAASQNIESDSRCDGYFESLDAIHFEHPRLCNHFYKCNGKGSGANDIKCPEKLVYNSKLEVCDWPHAVDCGTRTEQD